jgi:DNA-directed RNA polymerase specialized sigma24 family protein
MDDLHQHLRQLARKACSCCKDSGDRRDAIDCLIRQLVASGKLWHKAGLSADDYDDILQKTWIYLYGNLCEATTAAQPYDPDRASVLTWINAYIKMRTLDALLDKEWQQRNYAYSPPSTAENPLDPIDLLPAPSEVPPILQELRQWLSDYQTSLCRIHIRDRPQADCHTLILRRLPPEETPWKTLAQEFDIPEPTLRSFYRQKCLPRLKEAGAQLGYLEKDR